MDINEFYEGLGKAIRALDEAKGAQDLADAAHRRLSAKQSEIDALAAAHAKLKADSDKHLADNLAKLNEETAKHQSAVDTFKKQMAQLQVLNKTQQENAGSTLTALNTQIGVARKELQEMEVKRESMRNNILDLAKQV